jgi:hypothetical protein
MVIFLIVSRDHISFLTIKISSSWKSGLKKQGGVFCSDTPSRVDRLEEIFQEPAPCP